MRQVVRMAGPRDPRQQRRPDLPGGLPHEGAAPAAGAPRHRRRARRGRVTHFRYHVKALRTTYCHLEEKKSQVW